MQFVHGRAGKAALLLRCSKAYLSVTSNRQTDQEIRPMNRASRFTGGFGRFFNQVRAARACATALEAGRLPSDEALRTLGLDRNTFTRGL